MMGKTTAILTWKYIIDHANERNFMTEYEKEFFVSVIGKEPTKLQERRWDAFKGMIYKDHKCESDKTFKTIFKMG